MYLVLGILLIFTLTYNLNLEYKDPTIPYYYLYNEELSFDEKFNIKMNELVKFNGLMLGGYFIFGLLIVKVIPNLFRFFYFLFLPFSILFLWIKKTFLKLEDIEKKLKK